MIQSYTKKEYVGAARNDIRIGFFFIINLDIDIDMTLTYFTSIETYRLTINVFIYFNARLDGACEEWDNDV